MTTPAEALERVRGYIERRPTPYATAVRAKQLALADLFALQSHIERLEGEIERLDRYDPQHGPSDDPDHRGDDLCECFREP